MSIETPGRGPSPASLVPPAAVVGGSAATLTGAGRLAAWLARQVELGLAGVDLSLSQYRVLSLLAQGSAVSSDLAHRLDVRPPSVTAVVDGLVARGLVARRHAEGDRRCVDLNLTPRGAEALRDADAAVEERLAALLQELDDPGRAQSALDGLAAWREAMAARARARGLR